MGNKDGIGIIDGFFEKIDEYIRNNLEEITCSELRALYNEGVWGNSKKYRGGHGNLTGFFELFIFRFMVHYLGGVEINNEEKKINFTAQDFCTQDFCFGRKDEQFFIAQDISVTLKKGKARPDITIWRNGKLKVVIELKLTPPKSEDIYNDCKKLQKIHKERKTYGVLICNDEWKPDSAIGKVLKNFKSKNGNKEWFKYISLEENERGCFKDVLDRARIFSKYKEKK